jgi:hypothetical protein
VAVGEVELDGGARRGDGRGHGELATARREAELDGEARCGGGRRHGGCREDVEGGANNLRQSTKRERRRRFGTWRRTPLSGLAQTHGVWLDAEGTSSG